MGVVVMGTEDVTLIHGYPFVNRNLFVYCDQCASFDIRTYTDWFEWGVIFIVCAIVGGGCLFLFQFDAWVYPFLFVFAWAVFSKFLIRDAEYACRKCGSKTSKVYNTRRLTSDDRSVVDVREEMIQKRYMEYWPDLYDLEEELLPPPESETVDKSPGE